MADKIIPIRTLHPNHPLAKLEQAMEEKQDFEATHLYNCEHAVRVAAKLMGYTGTPHTEVCIDFIFDYADNVVEIEALKKREIIEEYKKQQ